MGLGHKRENLRMVAEAKLGDAMLLLANGRYSNAYYLAGYAVEVGLKACIAAQFVAEVIPDKSFVNAIYNHNISQLVGTAGLSSELQKAQDADPAFAASFAMAAQWAPDSRYETKDAMSAETLFAAINDPDHGVMQWIKKYW